LELRKQISDRPSGEAARTLETRGVRVAFAGVLAVRDVSLELTRGEILGLIGPNGAGKTTLVNVLSGFVRPTQGQIFLDGRDISRVPVHARAGLGLARTFQSVRLFGRLTVRENIEAAALATGLRGRRARARTHEVLEQMALSEESELLAAQLSYGAERRVGVARALATGAAFLLLDEPAAGLDDSETAELSRLLARIRAELGIGMLVIEHDMALVMAICDRVHVLAEGATIAVGTPQEIRAHPEVQQAYLGNPGEAAVAHG
jgi:ABC-type branched-subunit amino acid transport system ATPase component